ncbi:MAG: hypothetical protein CL675_00430 [Bdellovibrionaceae bacterium]|nr:hypothetical protein [Pseudobdellovibrionaceae bacterium]
MTNRIIAFAITTLLTSLSLASDIVLEGERWKAEHSGYRCAAFAEDVAAPLSHQQFQVQFTSLTTDYSLDNILLKATFVEGEALCRYSVLLLADNTAQTTQFVQSKAYSENESSSCAAGKALLDSQLSSNTYLYWGHPHHATILFSDASAQDLCGEGMSEVGLDFILTGRIQSN